MGSNSFGHILTMTTAGESHGVGYTCILDGVPAGLELTKADFAYPMSRRRPGQSSVTTSRKERDQVDITSGTSAGFTTGAPITLFIKNEDAKPQDYDHLANVYRPGHADYTYQQKYGIRDHKGAGRSSARETLCRVAAAVVAGKIIKTFAPRLQVLAYTQSIGSITYSCPRDSFHELDHKLIDQSPIRCPCPNTSEKMQRLIEKTKDQGDSLGGICKVIACHLPVGLGSPIFWKLKSDLASALFSMPAVIGVEFGAGFSGTQLLGSQFNDQMKLNTSNNQMEFITNNHGGIMGGISSGAPLEIQVAIKPPSSIAKKQKVVRKDGTSQEIKISGRHDPCLLPRAVPVVEAMVNFVLADHILLNRSLSSL